MIKVVFDPRRTSKLEPTKLPDYDTKLLKLFYLAFPSWREALENPSASNVWPPDKLIEQVEKFLAKTGRRNLAYESEVTDDEWSFVGSKNEFYLAISKYKGNYVYYINIGLTPAGDLDPKNVSVTKEAAEE